MIWNDSKSSDDYSCDSSSNIRDRLSRQIEEATIMTFSGLLGNIREAEVRLVFGCRVSSSIRV